MLNGPSSPRVWNGLSILGEKIFSVTWSAASRNIALILFDQNFLGGSIDHERFAPRSRRRHNRGKAVTQRNSWWAANGEEDR